MAEKLQNTPVYEISNFITHCWKGCCGVFSIPDYENGDLKCNECGASLKEEIDKMVETIEYYTKSLE